MTTFMLPDPALILLVGAAGSGKSTLAARLFAPGEILSSDAFRAAIAGDPRDQRATGAAFRALARVLDERLAAGLSTVIDATNVQARDRRPLIAAAARHGIPVAAIVLDLPPDVVLAQNAGRDRVVDDRVIHRHLAGLRRTLGREELAAERVEVVAVVQSAEEAAALVVGRRR